MEIGSEFELSNLDCYDNFPEINSIVDYRLVFSGRTAIELVLINEPNIRSALLPSYCCSSMLEPFVKRGIDISFYNVYYKEGIAIDLEIDKNVDCILWCNYFGFNTPMPNLDKFINEGGIVIEDITHSFLSDNNYNAQSHYLVASLRKWTSVYSGGYIVSRVKKLKTNNLRSPDQTFLEEKKLAMTMKSEYLNGNNDIQKDEFLRLFSKTNERLKENYSKVSIDEYSKYFLKSADYDRLRDLRRSNANVLYKELSSCKDIKFLYPIDEMDCPLFVPIILDSEIRNYLRKELIKNHIYCPIHWPRPEYGCESNLYDLELSLVCDHRYGHNEMQTIAKVIKRSIL